MQAAGCHAMSCAAIMMAHDRKAVACTQMGDTGAGDSPTWAWSVTAHPPMPLHLPLMTAWWLPRAAEQVMFPSAAVHVLPTMPHAEAVTDPHTAVACTRARSETSARD